MVAFLAVYLIWGSTYLAIRFAVETLPPFSMASARFLSAGALLFLWGRSRGAPVPTRGQWGASALVGGLLLMGGNGAVVWAAQWVPSGLVALLVATAPLWMVLVHWMLGGPRPGAGLWAGLLIGLAGVVLLVGSDDLGGGGARGVLGGLVVVAGSFCWAVGSVVQRRLDLPDPQFSPATQMIAGGAIMGVAALLFGEPARFAPDGVTLRSAAALLYLIVFGSIVAFSAYVWLLRVSTPAHVGTYAYVNPVVALVLGWALAGESLTGRALAASAVILIGVTLIGALGGGGRRGGTSL